MVGSTISHYKVLSELGRGGIALKFLPTEAFSFSAKPDGRENTINARDVTF